MKLHLILWYWQGWRPVYGWGHVNAMVRMLRPELPANARIICITDQVQTAWRPAECEVYPLWKNPVRQFGNSRDNPNCFLRLKLFNADTQRALGIEPGDVVWWKDLDSLVLPGWSRLIRPLDYWGMDGPVVDFAAMGGLAARIHGSTLAFRAGTHQYLWEDFHPLRSPGECMLPMADGTPRPIGSDQAWMSRKVTGEHLWQAADGCYSWNRHGLIMPPAHTSNAVYWSFAGPNKPWMGGIIKQARPDLYEAYMTAYGEG